MAFFQHSVPKASKEESFIPKTASSSTYEDQRFGGQRRGYGPSYGYKGFDGYNARKVRGIPTPNRSRAQSPKFPNAKSLSRPHKKWVQFHSNADDSFPDPPANHYVQEETPEWFDENGQKSATDQYDFAKTVQRTKAAEIKSHQVVPPPKEKNWEFDADDIDAKLEKMFKEQNENALQISDDDASLIISKKADLNDSDDNFNVLQAQLQTFDQKCTTKTNAQPENDVSGILAKEVDAHINGLAEQAFSSKSRFIIHRDSLNGFFRSKIDTFIAVFPKVFSSLMHEDIFAPVWLYKDNLKNVLGPFMSYDMDLWLAEGDYFSKSLMISYHGKGFFPIDDYVQGKPHIRAMFKPFNHKPKILKDEETEVKLVTPSGGEKNNNASQEKEINGYTQKQGNENGKEKPEVAEKEHTHRLRSRGARMKDPPHSFQNQSRGQDPAQIIMKALGII